MFLIQVWGRWGTFRGYSDGHSLNPTKKNTSDHLIGN